MSLPKHLTHSYRRYKQAQQVFLDWVTETSTAVGYDNLCQNDYKGWHAGQTKSTSITSGTESAKRRPRERTLPQQRGAAQDAAPTDSINEKESMKPSTLKLYQILPAVRAIVRDPSQPQAPPYVTEALYKVVQLRTQCVAWYRTNTSQCDNSTHESTDRHQHVIDVLKQAAACLMLAPPPLTTPSPRTIVEATRLKSCEDKLCTLFSSLKVHETTLEGSEPESDRHTSTDDTVPSSGSTNCDPASEEEELLQAEYNLARYCFFEDAREIEDFLVLEMISASLRPVLSSTLAVLTNLGHDLVKKTEDEMIHIFGDRVMDLERRFLATVQVTRISDIDQPLLRMRAVLLSQIGGQNKDIMDPEVLKTVSPFSRSQSLVVGYEKWRVQSVFAQKGHCDMELYMALLADASDASSRAILSLADCEILSTSRGCTYASVFAFRINMLMAYVIRSQNLSLDHHLQHTAESICQASHRQKQKWSRQSHDLSGHPKLQEIILEQVNDLVRSTSDITVICHSHADLLRHKPLLCLLNATNISFRHSFLNVQVQRYLTTIVVLAHLYDILTAEKLVQSAWLDVEFLAEHDLPAFNGPRLRAKDRASFKQHLARACGFLKKEWLTDFRNTGKRFLRRFATSADLMTMTRLQLARAEEDFCIGISSRECVKDCETIATATVLPRLQDAAQHRVELDGRAFINRQELYTWLERQPRMDHTQLLAAVDRGLENEKPSWNFGYSKFQEGCLGLLDEVADAWEDEIENRCGIRGWDGTLERVRDIALSVLARGMHYDRDLKARETYLKSLRKIAHVFESGCRSMALPV